jgi:5-methylcytosine-specific restriction endonuclease McrA
LQDHVEAGLSIAQIATALGRSKATVRYWLHRHRLQTSRSGGRLRDDQVRAARALGLSQVRMTCAQHGDTAFVVDRRGYYRCKRSRSAAVTRRRRKVKAVLVAEAGGACSICGYARCQSALEFHHQIPSDKAFALSEEGVTRSIARARAEAAKCVLLCANCHAEVEAGTATFPVPQAEVLE